MKIERKVEKEKDKVKIISSLTEELDNETFERLKKQVEYQILNLTFQISELEGRKKKILSELPNYNKKHIEKLKKELEIIEKLKEIDKIEEQLKELKAQLEQFQSDSKVYGGEEKQSYIK